MYHCTLFCLLMSWTLVGNPMIDLHCYLVIQLDIKLQEKGGKINTKLPPLQFEISFSILFI